MKLLSLYNLEWLENMKTIFLVLILSVVFYTTHSQADFLCERVMRTYVRLKFFKRITPEEAEHLKIDQIIMQQRTESVFTNKPEMRLIE